MFMCAHVHDVALCSSTVKHSNSNKRDTVTNVALGL